MRKGGGKQKGSAFERMVCERLSLCVTKGANRDVFWRSATSGGRGTLLKKRGKEEKGNQAGDITSVGPEGHRLTSRVYIECKFYRDLSLQSFLLGLNKGGLYNFWKQTKEAAKQHNREPMLIAKQNNVPALVITRKEAFPVRFAGASATEPICIVIPHVAHVYFLDTLYPPCKSNRPKLKKGVKGEALANDRTM